MELVTFPVLFFLQQCMQCCKKQQYPGMRFVQSAIVAISIFAYV